MNLLIVAFLAFGACFGVATLSHQHIFSEGITSKDKQGPGVLWVLICSFLWPLMALTGLHSWWRLARARARSRHGSGI